MPVYFETNGALNMKHAFSLVELSIVLVILGLITGGILTGQNLIRAAELRSIATDFNSYQTATKAFQDKYYALPGDLPNATDYWGEAGTCPGDVSTPSVDKATCNGDGNGFIQNQEIVTGNTSDEIFRFWQHLVNAGLLEGNYAGVRAHATNQYSQIGWNVPAGKIRASGWSVHYWADTVPKNYPGTNGQFMVLGAESGTSVTSVPILYAEEMWNIDKKIDDGLPAYGIVFSRDSTSRPDCVTSTTASDATYKLDSDEISCSVYFKFRN
jgi:prepilin-type N-terminal cleavage/methylation domain-containing protein